MPCPQNHGSSLLFLRACTWDRRLLHHRKMTVLKEITWYDGSPGRDAVFTDRLAYNRAQYYISFQNNIVRYTYWYTSDAKLVIIYMEVDLLWNDLSFHLRYHTCAQPTPLIPPYIYYNKVSKTVPIYNPLMPVFSLYKLSM